MNLWTEWKQLKYVLVDSSSSSSDGGGTGSIAFICVAHIRRTGIIHIQIVNRSRCACVFGVCVPSSNENWNIKSYLVSTFNGHSTSIWAPIATTYRSELSHWIRKKLFHFQSISALRLPSHHMLRCTVCAVNVLFLILLIPGICGSYFPSFSLSLSPSRLFRFYCISVLCVRLLCFVQFMLLIVDKWHKHGVYCVFAVNTCSPIEHSPNECRQTLQMMPLHSLPLPLSPAPLVRLCVCGPHLTDRKFWRRVCGSNAKIMFSFG